MSGILRLLRQHAKLRASSDSSSTKRGFWALLIFGLLTVIAPLVAVLWNAFAGTEDTAVTRGLDRWWEVVSGSDTLHVLRNTIIFSVGTVTLGGAIGFLLALVITRVKVPGAGGLAEILPVMSLFMPPLLGSLGWMFLGAPDAGFLNTIPRLFAGVGPHASWFNVFSVYGIIIVGALYLVPFVYLYLQPAMAQVSSELEEAARVSGASGWFALCRITIPIIRPALLSTLVVIVMISLAEFSVPLFLGSGIGFDVLALKIWQLASVVYPSQPQSAAILGTLLLIPAVLGLYIQRRLSRGAGRYQVIAGKGRAAQPLNVGRWSYVVAVAIWGYVIVAVVMPVVAVVVVAFQRYWTGNLHQIQLTVGNIARAVQDPIAITALLTSLRLALIGATVGIIVAFAMAVIATQTRIRGRALLEYISLLPLGIPNIVFGLGFLLIVFAVASSLYGTTFVLIAAYVVVFLPLAVQSLSSGLKQLGSDLTEASRVSGASFFQSARLIMIPLLRRFLLSGWLILFVVMFRELPVSEILAPSGGGTLTSLYLVNQWQNALYPDVASFGLLIFVINAAVVSALYYVQRRSDPTRQIRTPRESDLH